MYEPEMQDRQGPTAGEVMMPDMELALAARAENIAIVRHALGGFGEAFAVSDQKLADIRLAVTEACANVVVHAYPGDGSGPMEVLAHCGAHELTVVVRDQGCGIRPRSDTPGLGLGLSMMAALAKSVQLGHDGEAGTEVRMTFALADEVSSPAGHRDAAEETAGRTPTAWSPTRETDS